MSLRGFMKNKRMSPVVSGGFPRRSMISKRFQGTSEVSGVFNEFRKASGAFEGVLAGLGCY